MEGKREVNQCRITGNILDKVLDFGCPYVSNFVDSRGEGERFPLSIGLETKINLLQLYNSYPPDKMYTEKYWYRSGVNESMRNTLRGIVESAQKWVPLYGGETILDVGGNDNTLISFYPDNIWRVNIDPSPLVHTNIPGGGCICRQGYFSKESYLEGGNSKAKIITSIAMFYDLEDPGQFVEDIYHSLDDDGIWIIEMAYLPLVLKNNAFDFWCSEHVALYTIRAFNYLLQFRKLYILDIELTPTNGGSIRFYVAKNEIGGPILNSIGRSNLSALTDWESQQKLDDLKTYKRFSEKIENLRAETISFLQKAKEDGKLVCGYGSSTKGNTLLQYYNIGPELLPCIADRSPEKIGKLTAGSWIPIVSEEEMRKMKPDFLFILPWHFIDGFKAREKELLNRGTKLVVPLPELEVMK